MKVNSPDGAPCIVHSIERFGGRSGYALSTNRKGTWLMKDSEQSPPRSRDLSPERLPESPQRQGKAPLPWSRPSVRVLAAARSIGSGPHTAYARMEQQIVYGPDHPKVS